MLAIPALGEDAPRSPDPKPTRLPRAGERRARARPPHGASRSCPTDGCWSRNAQAGCAWSVAAASSRRRWAACRRSRRRPGRPARCGADPRLRAGPARLVSFSEPGEGGAGTAVARGRLSERGLEDAGDWRQRPRWTRAITGARAWCSAPTAPCSSRSGDRGYREQRPGARTAIGKIIRINPDGTIPRDNPFVGRDGARPEIWSYGIVTRRRLRSTRDRQLWTVEHGARGGDEVNNPQPGAQLRLAGYHLRHRLFRRAKIGEGTRRTGMEQPVYYWDTVIAPSGAVFYTGKAFPAGRATCSSARWQPAASCACVSSDGRVTAGSATWVNLASACATSNRAPTG